MFVDIYIKQQQNCQLIDSGRLKEEEKKIYIYMYYIFEYIFRGFQKIKFTGFDMYLVICSSAWCMFCFEIFETSF